MVLPTENNPYFENFCNLVINKLKNNNFEESLKLENYHSLCDIEICIKEKISKFKMFQEKLKEGNYVNKIMWIPSELQSIQ